MLKKGIVVGVVVLVVLAGGFTGAVQLRWDRTFEAPYPELRAVDDPELIERGRYLAYGPAHCAYCHTPNDQASRLEAGEELPMIGGHEWELPFGKVVSPNLTPDAETGIGRRSDAELARILRHGVRADGRAAVPMMEFQMMSDEDLVAVLSFLRSQEPVRHVVDDHAFNLLGKAVLALAIEPVGPAEPPLAMAPSAEATLERGAYVANDVAGCAACHTARDLRTGAYTNEYFAGGGTFDVVGADGARMTAVAPNITPDPATGVLAQWTEDQFVHRFHEVGRQVEASPMPWAAYAKMSEADLRAVYRYLMSLDPVENDVGPVLR